jgi:hypothetical protein
MMVFPFGLSSAWVRLSIVALVLWLLVGLLRYLVFILRSKKIICCKGEVLTKDFSEGSLEKERSSRLKIKYKYFFNGKVFYSNKISPVEYFFPFTFSAERKIISSLNKIVSNSKPISVYFFKEKPQIGYLNVDVQFGRILLALVFIVLLLGILWFSYSSGS